MFTSRNASQQPIPTDPAEVWDLRKRILFAVARKVKLAIRLNLDGHGRGEAEPEELVNDAFICVMEALPRFNPATAKFITFVYGLARRRMWSVARAAFYGLSPEQMHRMDAAKRTPRFHYDVNDRSRKGRTLGFAKAIRRRPEADGEERLSLKRVDAIRGQLPEQDRRMLDMWLQEGGNVSAVARQLHAKRSRTQDRYYRLFRKIAATA